MEAHHTKALSGPLDKYQGMPINSNHKTPRQTGQAHSPNP